MLRLSWLEWMVALLMLFAMPFYFSLSVDYSSRKSGEARTGLIVIPGLGRSDRLQTVIHNLNMLRNYIGNSWDCVVYIYAPREDLIFWDESEKIEYVRKYCRIVEHPRKRFTENLFLVQPALLKSCYKYLFVLLDDQKLLGGAQFPLDKMLEIMEFNSLSVASPKVKSTILLYLIALLFLLT